MTNPTSPGMRFRIGYELVYHFPQPTPVVLMLSVHPTRVADLERPDHICIEPDVLVSSYRDVFANKCSRFLAPSRITVISTSTIVRDSGQPDRTFPDALQTPIQDLPGQALGFLIASRYCDSDKLLGLAWALFGRSQPGWQRVQAICDFVHQRITFGYQHARATRSASEAYEERRGVCRDYAHLAIAFCRALNIPARYCAGYLSDVGTPAPYPPGDFAAWFEAYLGGQWHTFDPRNNAPRTGRILIARGRDAADVAFSTTFGPNTLQSFRVWTDEVTAQTSAMAESGQPVPIAGSPEHSR